MKAALTEADENRAATEVDRAFENTTAEADFVLEHTMAGVDFASMDTMAEVASADTKFGDPENPCQCDCLIVSTSQLDVHRYQEVQPAACIGRNQHR